MSPFRRSLHEFWNKFDASLDPRLWVSLIEEEVREYKEAPLPEEILKEAADVMYVLTGFDMLMDDGSNLYQWLTSEEEFARWEAVRKSAAEVGIEATHIFGPNVLKTAFERVHQSNLSKLGKDGKPVRRKDGKILKGPNYLPPDLSDLV